MKKVILVRTAVFSLLLFTSVKCFSQNKIDSLKKLLLQAKEDTSKVLLLGELAKSYQDNKIDTTLLLAREGILLAEKLNYPKGEANCRVELGEALFVRGDMPAALDMYLKVLKLREKIGDTKGIVSTYTTLNFLYNYSGEPEKGLSYGWQAFKILEKDLQDDELLAKTQLHMGGSYGSLGEKDSSLEYINKAYAIAQRIDDKQLLGESFRSLGFYNARNGEETLAMEYYRRALENFVVSNNQRDIAWTQFMMTLIFLARNETDSALLYTNRSLDISRKANNPWGIQANYFMLSRIYEGKNDAEALKYFKLAKQTGDSLQNADKTLAFENLTQSENRRQGEIEAAKLKAKETRKQNLQYAGIALSLIILATVFLLLSHSIIANERVIKFLGILALLIVFEFINLLVHPFVEKITHHSAVWMLTILVGIAAILIPLHHLLEKWIVHRMINKNKKIRLAAAKKTIADLEPPTSESPE